MRVVFYLRLTGFRSSYVESRLRHLVLKLEFVENLVLAHPFMKAFDKTIVCHTEQQAMDAGRGIFHSEAAATAGDESGQKDATNGESKNGEATEEAAPAVESAGRTVHTSTYYIGMAIEPRPAGSSAPRRLGSLLFLH